MSGSDLKVLYDSNGGFIALISAIIIAAILLVITATISLGSFYSRYNVLDAELKEQSLALAEACADIAMIEILNNSGYLGNATTTISTEECYIGPILVSGSNIILKTRSMYKNYNTNMEIVLNANTLEVIRWEETSNF